MKLVLVEWIDSCSQSGWHPLDISYEGLSACISIGIKIFETDEYVTVAPSGSRTTRRFCDTISIPKACIKRIRYLKVK